MKKLLIIIFILSIVTAGYFMLIENNTNQSINNISIAEQYGLGYAPIQIMKENEILANNLKREMDNVEISWKRLGNTTAIRESMIAGKLDIGFVAIPPFLIGRDKGMDWKIMSGLSMSPLGLVTNKNEINTLIDFKENDKIALPQPGSIQHILLAMASDREFNNAKKFDNRLVTMNHPDGMNALLSDSEITAHFTSPPYLFKELKEDNLHQVLSGKEALGGEFTFIVGVATADFFNNNKQMYQIFIESLIESIEFINSNKREAASILAKEYNLTTDEVYEYITHPEMKYTTEIKGVREFMDFMNKTEYISFDILNINELVWNEVNNEKK